MNTPRTFSLCTALAFLVSCDQEDNSTIAKETAPQPTEIQTTTPPSIIEVPSRESKTIAPSIPLPTTTEVPAWENETIPSEISLSTTIELPSGEDETDAPEIIPFATTEAETDEDEGEQTQNETEVRTRGMKVKKNTTAPLMAHDDENADEPNIPAEEQYNNGEGAPADAKQAIKWYKKFADAGIADAQFKLAECYYNTRSEPRNFVKAVAEYRAAAEQGHTEACRKLAMCYQMGIGTEVSEQEAMKWRIAAGDMQSKTNEENFEDM